MIYFRSRKYETELNASFSLRWDGKPGDSTRAANNFRVGDTVSLLLDVSPEQARAINDMRHMGIRANNAGVIGDDDWKVHIPFRVADRSHSIAPADQKDHPGTLNYLGASICLEAENGFWEDVLVWIMMGERPRWAIDDEDVE